LLAFLFRGYVWSSHATCLSLLFPPKYRIYDRVTKKSVVTFWGIYMFSAWLQKVFFFFFGMLTIWMYVHRNMCLVSTWVCGLIWFIFRIEEFIHHWSVLWGIWTSQLQKLEFFT
jgi:hypothetical protein